MTTFEKIKDTLDILIKDKNDTVNMAQFFHRFLEEKVGQEFILYLNERKLINWTGWFTIYNSYYTSIAPKYKSEEMNSFLYDFSCNYFENFVKNHNNDEVEKSLQNIFPEHIFMETKLAANWLKDKEVHFFKHLFSHLKFTPFSILRKALSYMATYENECLIFDENGLKLLNKTLEKEGLDKFLEKIDSEVLFNSNFSSFIIPKMIEKEKAATHYLNSWGPNGNKTGLLRLVSPNAMNHGGGLAITQYLLTNQYIDKKMFEKIMDDIFTNQKTCSLLKSTVSENKFLAHNIKQDISKITYLIDKFDLDINKSAIFHYDELILQPESYIDRVIELKEHYKGSKNISLGFPFIMNSMINNTYFDFTKPEMQSKIEKLIMLTNKKQLDKKELMSNAVKYLTHQKNSQRPERLQSFTSHLEKLYFELTHENEMVLPTKKKLKL